MHDSGASRRESANARLGVIARSEATKQSILSSRGEMDCFAALAMTAPHLDRMCCLKLEPRHCEERSDEAIHSFFARRDGLLRFARNDGSAPGSSVLFEIRAPSLRGAKRRSNPFFLYAARWIASRSLSSGAHSRDPVARNDGVKAHHTPNR